MRSFISCFALLTLLLLPGAAQSAPLARDLPLLPEPARLTTQAGQFPLQKNFSITWTRYRNPLLERAAQRFLRHLNLRTGMVFTPGAHAPGLRIDCAGADPAFLTIKANEAYRLNVDPKGIRLSAAGPTGVLRGLATLLQLALPGAAGYHFPDVTIDDEPRFAWRGLMIDVSRHFMPLPDLERQLDAMEAVKLNVLHLHLSDAQGFRVESKLFPKLQQLGSAGQFYTQAEIRQLIAKARDRGIRIVPEFDVPGHSKSWLVAYPELASAPGPYQLGPDAAERNATFDPSNPAVYRFLNRFIGEMSSLFPDRYFHIGGDEVNGLQWRQNPRIQQFMRRHGFTTTQQLQAYFTRRVDALVAAHGKTMIGWDEVLDGGAPANSTIETWRSSKMTAVSVQAGHPTIVSAGYYLDLDLDASVHYRADPLNTAAFGMLTPQELKTVQGTPLAAFMTEEVVAGPRVPLSPAQQALILGGEAPLWAEIVTPEMLDGRLWPRSAAIAERFWSPASVRGVRNMYHRLDAVDSELAQIGMRQHAHQRRMLSRMVVGDDAPVETFIQAVEPLKYYARVLLHIRKPAGARPPLNSLADAAFPESLVARRFNQEVSTWLQSPRADPALTRHLRNQLLRWRDNDDAFRRLAQHSALLQPGLPVSADLKALAQAGLEALADLQYHRAPSSAWIARQRTLLARQHQAAAASSDVLASFLRPQPPSQLLIAIVPGVEQLIHAAQPAPNQGGSR